jgi:hypothetical protein
VPWKRHARSQAILTRSMHFPRENAREENERMPILVGALRTCIQAAESPRAEGMRLQLNKKGPPLCVEKGWGHPLPITTKGLYNRDCEE